MSTVIYENKGDAIALITLDRPKALNAFNGAMRADFLDAIAKASANPAIRAVVVTGAGRGFCAGADVTDVQEGRNVEDILNAEYAAFLTVIRTCEKPVIAAINGPAAGIGMTTALTCDLKVMAEDAYLMPAFANIGLVPDGGLSWLMTQEMGYSRAYQAAIEAEKISSEKSLAYGLVNRVVANGEAVDEALRWAEELCERAPIATALTKRAFRAAAHAGLPAAAATEAQLQRTAMASDDCKEGIVALMQKRKPVFKGQ